ncbi:MAG TPA: hypothetical protein VE987_08965, partial [Polyangiaceae bacterium]|nr:hypothetical protein [Polyangiaceae bacterium]
FIAEVPSPAWLARLDSLPRASHASVERTGPSTFLYTDEVVGASIVGRVLSEEQWLAAIGDGWSVRVRPLGDLEWLIVARRR